MLSNLLLLAVFGGISGHVLVPPYTNLALGRKIAATSTCGELNGQAIKEMFCQIAGSSQYTPLNQYSYSTDEDGLSMYAELKMEKQSFVQGGQICDFCHANTSFAHPATNMVDGRASWWQSPPLSRGMQYNQVNISISLEQEFHVAYVWIQMANSPRPGSWVLERSINDGETYTPWQYFAETPAECDRLFGRQTLQPILEDDTVICTHEFSGIHPMENAEIMINLLENRPGKLNFSHSEVLQNFTRATNVRLRLLRTKTLHGHLMDVNRRDPTVTRRYFYSIKEIFMGGRCVCNGHADTCDILDMRRSNILLCRCEHNTCGDHCEKCCPGFEQKMWRRSKEGDEFTCERCNCNGHSEECTYEKELDEMHASLDLHGNYEGGGRCLNCRDNTEGINCNKCSFGYYRPPKKFWNETDVCQPCDCDLTKHTGKCDEETGRCECLKNFVGQNCDQCARGYYNPPECKPCDCSVNGTFDNNCLPIDGQCPCKNNFNGTFCHLCATGYTNITDGCSECVCDATGSLHNICDKDSGQCVCKTNFANVACSVCADGYFGYPICEYCDCDASGTERGICDKMTGACLCTPGFSGSRCDECDLNFFGYPHCRGCGCNSVGSKSSECDQKTGECPCYANFTGKKCDRCAAGFYDYPNCKPCSCLASGSKGMTCDNDGQCYCKHNFQGERCDECKTNFYNFPICEECNCHPSGVVSSFAGCDKVAPGELCTCKSNVIGRVCDQCKPTFWDLQYHHETGCVKCECDLAGTVSELNDCSLTDGQCNCKSHVSGHKCDLCADGFYKLDASNPLGCQVCACDVGGALGVNCDINTGACRCRPRIKGQKCDKPIENHYFPTLWHNKYEAEDGVSVDNKAVRFAIDHDNFENYSWRGYVVFSPIQEDIYLDVVINRASLYRLLFHYVNPTDITIDAKVTVIPLITRTQDVEQTSKVSLLPTLKPITVEVNAKQPFELNPGDWRVKISTKQRLFLDYIVMLPSEYYEGAILRERAFEPCEITTSLNTICIDLLYPPLPLASRVDAVDEESIKEITENDDLIPVEKMPVDILPPTVGEAVLLRAGNQGMKVKIGMEIPEENDYVLILEYHKNGVNKSSVFIDLVVDDEVQKLGEMTVKHCPYSIFCREIVTKNGSVAVMHLEKKNAEFIITTEPNQEFGLAALNVIKEKEWNTDYLQQIPVCIRKNDQCLHQSFPPAANAILTEAESLANANSSISGDKLPFIVSHPKNLEVMALDENPGTLEISGVVPARGDYVFVVQYFNPDNTPLTFDVTLQNGHLHHAQLPISYCPSVIGCRAVIVDRERPDVKHFLIDDKYTASFYFNSSQKGPLYIDSITTVSESSYNNLLLHPQPIDVSSEFIRECGENYFKNDPANATDFCRRKVFSLTTEYNMAASSCDCSSQGSTSFICDEYGGQCSCRSNIIGRRCDRCAPGYYSFPECIKCRCPANHLCDEQTGQCYCPPHVEGKQCDRCVPYAFGYDALIGCQLCGCQPNGSEGGQLQCDPNNGQCLCKSNVGGRKCGQCLPGFYGFPHCYDCSCELKGTTDEICDLTSAACKCKKNVIGESCDSCRLGTFDLQISNFDGCAECFCFGATDRCRSSFLPISFIDFDEEAWKSTDVEGKITRVDNAISYLSQSTDTISDIFFLVPLPPDQDLTSSYGLQLSFLVSSQPRAGEMKMSHAPDVQLFGSNITLDFWAREQPADAKEPFHVELRLLPDNFMDSSGKPTSRVNLMMVLRDLSELRIKACYYVKCESATISDLQLEVAKNEPSTSEDTFLASSVEICQCPPPYSGLSCQQCSPGYHRVRTGRNLGACVPCDCNGHSGSCDAMTGLCFDCQHDTVGDHCELCREGFYGDATTGRPYSCLPCACPYSSQTNNFALSCQVSETGVLESCACKEGYSSERCERCDVGYFGDPSAIGGFCQKCDCNENNDLSVDGSCHPFTGHCDLCSNNTDGPHCDVCEAWYFGDAVGSRNCTDCGCDKCGSSECDNISGKCLCHPNVEGEHCDRCVTHAWGFSRCSGCQICNCAVASSSSQCHEETGQCPCMPGAAGETCDTCAYGYWNYGITGCSKCDCEADLSMGTVCDVGTGQCHCQEGAVGSRCDQCAPQYLRIPQFGCRLCDECVHSLIVDLDGLGGSIEFVNSTIGNVSTTALTGARLKRIENSVHEAKPHVLNQIGTSSEMGIDNLRGDVASAVAAASGSVIRANRSLHTLYGTNFRLLGLINQTDTFSLHTFENVENAEWIVSSLKNLTDSLSKDFDSADRKRWLQDSIIFLDQIREISNNVESALKVEEAYSDSNKVIGAIAKRRELGSSAKWKLVYIRDKLSYLLNNATEYKSYLQYVSDSIKDIEKFASGTKIFGFKSLSTGLEKVDIEIKEAVEETGKYKKDTEVVIDSLAKLNKLLNQVVENVKEAYGKLKGLNEKAVLKRSAPPQLAESLSKMEQLKQQAISLSDLFGSTRDDAKYALEAANGYRELMNSLKNSRDSAKNATAFLKEARTMSGNEMASSAKNLREKSADLLRSTGELKQKSLNELIDLKNNLNSESHYISSNIQRQQIIIDSFQNSFGDFGSMEKIEQSESLVDKANEKINEAISNWENFNPQLFDLINRSMSHVDYATETTHNVVTAKSQLLQQINEDLPVLKELEKLQNSAANTTMALKMCQEKLDFLREKVILARDLANKIKLGVHFEKGSSLELPLPPTITHSALTTLEFYFRTLSLDGLLVFLGNEISGARTRSDDFIALEVDGGVLRATSNLGDGISVIKSDRPVADGVWRRVLLERVGKRIILKVSAPNSAIFKEEGIANVPGSKFVFNVDKTSTRLFIGGIPLGVNVSANVHNREFVGDIENLHIQGEVVGLWNVRKGGNHNVQGATEKMTITSSSVEGLALSFNGNGYSVQKLESWNPRKQTIFSLTFQSYSPDGLLFYIGKDRDFILLELQDGGIKLSFDFGSGVGKLTSMSSNYNDGKLHSIYIHRVERHARMQIDDTNVVDGDSPGTMYELAVTNFFYVGGVPSDVSTRLPVVPWKGCIEHIKVDNQIVDLSRSYAAKGVQSGCQGSNVAVISLLSERSFATFMLKNATEDIELTFRFKTDRRIGHLISVQADDSENILQVRLENNLIVGEYGTELKDVVRVHLRSALDGEWHHVSVAVTNSKIRLDVDDLYTNEVDKREEYFEVSGVPALIHIGHMVDSKINLQGCIGDVIYNGKLFDFSQAKSDDIGLIGCTLADISKSADSLSATEKSLDDANEKSYDVEVARESVAQRKISMETSSVTPRVLVRRSDECALLRRPQGERSDSAGTRFGLSAFSRLEFDKPPVSFDKNSIFSVQIRPTASNGIIIFTTNIKHTDHLALYLVNGIVHFSYNSGSGQIILKANRSVMDDEWHSVRAEREGIAGTLYIDSVMEANGQSPSGTDAVDTNPPIYIGGLPSDLIPFAARILPGAKSVFGGCLRDFKLNEMKFDVPPSEIDTVPCSQFTEEGLYFGEQSGYAVLNKELKVGSSFNIELEVRPRLKTGILLSVGVLEFLTLHMIDGTVKFTVDNGAGPESVSHVPSMSNALCDGHWHHIKLYKTKNLLTLTVDGKSTLHIMKKSKKMETNTKDPLYLGGLPRGPRPKGLEKIDNFIGCVRVLNMGRKPRKRKNIDISQIPLFGDVAKNKCFVN